MASLKPTISGGIVVVENGGGIVVVENERASLQKPQTVLVDDLVDGLSLQKEVVLVDGLKDIQSAQKYLVDLISEGELDVGSPRIQQVYVSAGIQQKLDVNGSQIHSGKPQLCEQLRERVPSQGQGAEMPSLEWASSGKKLDIVGNNQVPVLCTMGQT